MVRKTTKVVDESTKMVIFTLDPAATCLSYDSRRELASQERLAYLSDNVLDEYADEAEQSLHIRLFRVY